MNTDIQTIVEAIKAQKPEFANATYHQIMMYYRHLTVEQRKQFNTERKAANATGNEHDSDI